MAFIDIQTTFSNLEEAQKITNHLLSERLIACANLTPIHSSYWWQGKIENVTEVLGMLKTTEEKQGEVEAEIKKMHSYHTPGIIKFKVEGSEEYEEWVKKEVAE